MYQWSIAQELAELGISHARPFSEEDRQRAELLRELEEEHPSLLDRIVTFFRHEPEQVIARTPIESELLGAVIEEGLARRAA